MLSLGTAFWLMVLLFALAGMLRGWTREVLVTTAVILALFTLNQFSPTLFGVLNHPASVAVSADQWRQEFYILSIVLILITFFGYQGPSVIGRGISDRLRPRDTIQEKILGSLAGAVNGYLIIGSIWSFLEYKVISPSNWERFPLNIPYPFPTNVLLRPTAELNGLIDNLPIPFLTSNPYIIPILLVLVVLFVLVVLL
jgi:uncharacterized membrane protein required for colicin V production